MTDSKEEEEEEEEMKNEVTGTNKLTHYVLSKRQRDQGATSQQGNCIRREGERERRRPKA